MIAWFTQHSQYEEKRSHILIRKISEVIILESPCPGVTLLVNMNGLYVELCHARFESSRLSQIDTSLHRNDTSVSS